MAPTRKPSTPFLTKLPAGPVHDSVRFLWDQVNAPTQASDTTGFVVRETPLGVMDSVNTQFRLKSAPVPGTESVFLAGLLLEPGTDYKVTGKILQMVVAPAPASVLRVSYHAQ